LSITAFHATQQQGREGDGNKRVADLHCSAAKNQPNENERANAGKTIAKGVEHDGVPRYS